tara:strand:+ start:278 stop:553 length:276 start_codon:yes stop_codon:yes gene_type:complete
MNKNSNIIEKITINITTNQGAITLTNSMAPGVKTNKIEIPKATQTLILELSETNLTLCKSPKRIANTNKKEKTGSKKFNKPVSSMVTILTF